MLDDAVSVTLAVLHVRSAGGAILTLGVVIFCVKLTDAEAIHPLDGSVAVTVYEPAALTVLVAVVIPPPQSKLTPSVDDDAVRVTLGTVQVKFAGGAIVTFGSVPFWFTVVDADALHPFDGSVTVTEYDPAVFTVFVADVTPPPQL